MNMQLIKAVIDNNITKVRKLLDPEEDEDLLDINFQEEKFGNTALHYAMHLNSTRIAELLLDHGAHLRIKNFKGEDPIESFIGVVHHRKTLEPTLNVSLS